MRQWQQRPTDDHATAKVIVFDLETIVTQETPEGSFPPWPRHRPVMGSFLTAAWTPERYTFDLVTLACEAGKEGQFYEQVDAMFVPGVTGVSVNGRGFYNAVLRLQAMAHQRFELAGIARQAQASRYSAVHADLADQFSSYGAARGSSLAEICAALSIPAKVEAHGSDVGALWRAGEHEKIRRYVESDVLATYLMWLHWSAFRASNEGLIALPLADLSRWLEASEGLEHLRCYATCPPSRWARTRAPALRVAAALVDAERRVTQEADERAFAGDVAF